MSAPRLPCDNDKCLYDLATFPGSAAVGASGDLAPLRCPACGEGVELKLESLGIFRVDKPTGPVFVAWKTRNSLLGDKTDVAIGLFRVQISGKLDVMPPEEVAFPRVPVFRGLDGKPCAPTLPVRPDRLAYLDPDYHVEPWRIEHQEYVVRIKLRGLDAPVDLRLPIMTSDPSDRAASDDVDRRAFRGINLRMWPRVAFAGWKRYYLSLGAVDAEGQKLFGGGRNVAASWITNGKVEPIAKVTAGGFARVACTSARPEWIGLEFKDEKGTVLGGGVWQVAPAKEKYAHRHITLGADFGTSNTAFAYREGDDPSALIPNSEPDYIIRSGEEPSELKHLEMWIPRAGFGPMKDLWASELVFANPVSGLGSEDELRKFKPIEDYCISMSGVRIAYDERPHLVSHLKWTEAVEPTHLRNSPLVPLLQQAYLEFVTFLCLGHIYAQAGDSAPGTVMIRFSYPLAFEDDDLKALRQVWAAVAVSLSETTGLTVNLDTVVVDEATAATESVPHELDTVRVVVDIGGGTTDVALLWFKNNTRDAAPIVYVTSFKYAGSTVLRSFHGGVNNRPNCLNPKFSAELVRRKIREAGSVGKAFRTDDLIQSGRSEVANERVRMYYHYLLEYIARLIVAPIARGNGFSDAQGKALKAPMDFNVELLLLGNGWGFGELIDAAGVAKMVEYTLKRRTLVLLRSLGRSETPSITLSVSVPTDAEHPKVAVAKGLLNITVGGKSSAKGISRRILGINTRVDRAELPWHLEVDSDGEHPPMDQDELKKGSLLSWDPAAEPAFPTKFKTPFEMDEKLRRSSRTLSEKTGIKGDWLSGSPFEALLETLLTNALSSDGEPYGN